VYTVYTTSNGKKGIVDGIGWKLHEHAVGYGGSGVADVRTAI